MAMSTAFRTTRRIEFADTDMAGIVHFANFFRFMEAAEVEFLRSRGLSVHMGCEGLTFGFPRVSASCDYLRPARFEDVLTVAVSVQNVGTKSVTYGFEFTLDGEVIAVGKVTSVCCLVNPDHSFVSAEIPASLRAKLQETA
jgi:YbgC/YbaW family acyl-CoA thioester hydrolase